MNGHRLTACCVLLLLLTALRGSAGADDAAITEAVASLSDADPAVRDHATQTLWRSGHGAEAALTAAAQSDDPETSRRASEILYRIRYGIAPDTPAVILDLVREYRVAAVASRLGVARRLADQGVRGLRVLLCLRRLETDEPTRATMLKLLGATPHLREGAALLIADGDEHDALDLLHDAADDNADNARDWAAYLLVRGGLDEQVTKAIAATKLSEDDHAPTRLAILARAAGNLKLAAVAADQTDNTDLCDNILIESSDWDRLALRYRQRVKGDVGTLAYTADFCRLAGDVEGFDHAVEGLKKLAKDEPDSTAKCAEDLMLCDRIDEGVALLMAHQDFERAADFLLPRLKADDAIALPAQAIRVGQSPEQVMRLQARSILAFRFIGDRDGALKLFEQLAAQDEQHPDASTSLTLAEAAHQLGFAGKVDHFLGVAMKSAGPSEGFVLSKLNLGESFPAVFAWRLLRSQHMGEAYEATLPRLRDLAAGKLAAAEIEDLITVAHDRAPRAAPQAANEDREALGDLLRVLHRYGQAEQSYLDLFEHFPVADPLMRAGDCRADAGDFAGAAALYEQAWDIDHTRAQPLALRGWALLKAGQTQAGRAAIELAHLLPLADDVQRTALDQIFRQHNLPDDARRERELIIRTGAFQSWHMGMANRICGDEELHAGHAMAAAEFWERGFLSVRLPTTTFINSWANVMIPARIHRERAAGLIKTDPAAAMHEAEAALADSPGETQNLIYMVQTFDDAGHRAEGDALFARVADPYAQLCRKYPSSGHLHNALAWVEACCHRQLDDALNHGLAAVKAEPTNTASIDTLAETYYQRGQLDEAIKQINRCIELEPAMDRHRQQLARFEAAKAHPGPATRPIDDD